MANLLVVDYDYFFPDPMQNDEPTLDALFYDWAHRETPLHIDGPLWLCRAGDFLANDLPLPPALPTQGFWDRFNLPAVPLLVGDSNVHAGALRPPAGEDGFEQVWLYDAHHDSGYGLDSVDHWRDRGTYSCEDWTLVHHLAGAQVHTRYPRWRTNAFRLEPEPLVEIDRDFDDGTPNAVAFDLVYLCRSGAWVPPWCDSGFAALVAAYPGSHVRLDGSALVRDFDLSAVQQLVALQRQVSA